MKHKIIQTENYLLVGNDNNSKRGWFYCFRTKNLFQDEGEDVLCCNGDMNIIAHLPLNNSPILEGVDLLPPIKDEAKGWARSQYSSEPNDYEEEYYLGLEMGYNKAKEKYNKNLIDWIDNISNSIFAFQANEIELKMLEQFKNKVQSLQQPKIPIGFECEIKKTEGRLMMIPPCKHCIKPKTITNSKGINQWVGKYIFD